MRWHGVRGFLIPGDVEVLWELAKALPKAGTHVEIGSWKGLSSIVFANALLANLNFDARIFCVDTWRGSEEHQDLPEVQQDSLFETFLSNVRDAKVQHFIQPLRGPSAQMAQFFDDGSVDSVFVDGDHTYEGCRKDIESWLPKLKAGGRMLGHDAAPDSGACKAVEEFAHEHGFGVEIARAARRPLRVGATSLATALGRETESSPQFGNGSASPRAVPASRHRTQGTSLPPTSRAHFLLTRLLQAPASPTLQNGCEAPSWGSRTHNGTRTSLQLPRRVRRRHARLETK